MQSIPLAVLKLVDNEGQFLHSPILHATHTACGIETRRRDKYRPSKDELHAIHTACGVEKGQVCAENP